jgi:hypothetical protein
MYGKITKPSYFPLLLRVHRRRAAALLRPHFVPAPDLTPITRFRFCSAVAT